MVTSSSLNARVVLNCAYVSLLCGKQKMKNLYLFSRLSWIVKVRNEVCLPAQLKVTSGIFTMHMGNGIYRATGATQHFKWCVTEAKAGDCTPIFISACRSSATVLNLRVTFLTMKYVNSVAVYLQIRALSSGSFCALWKEKDNKPRGALGRMRLGEVL